VGVELEGRVVFWDSGGVVRRDVSVEYTAIRRALLGGLVYYWGPWPD